MLREDDMLAEGFFKPTKSRKVIVFMLLLQAICKLA
jgi:hypothetical protein